MKKYLILLPIFILALFQGAFLPLNLVLLVILFLATARPAKESLLTAFLSGIFLDLASGAPLGYSSILLLISTFLAISYSRRFDPYHPLFIPVFVFMSAGIWSFVREGFTNWPSALILAVLSFLVRIILKILPLDYGERGRRLKV